MTVTMQVPVPPCVRCGHDQKPMQVEITLEALAALTGPTERHDCYTDPRCCNDCRLHDGCRCQDLNAHRHAWDGNWPDEQQSGSSAEVGSSGQCRSCLDACDHDCAPCPFCSPCPHVAHASDSNRTCTTCRRFNLSNISRECCGCWKRESDCVCVRPASDSSQAGELRD